MFVMKERISYNISSLLAPYSMLPFVRLSTQVVLIEREDSHRPKPNLKVLVTHTVEKAISRGILPRYTYHGIVHAKITVVTLQIAP